MHWMRLCRSEANEFDAAPRNRTISPGSTSRILGVDQVEGASLRGQHVCIVKLSQAQGAETARVADGVHLIARKHQQRVGALHLVERVGNRAGKIPAALRAIKCTITSVSLVVWKMTRGARASAASSRSSDSRCGRARLPFCSRHDRLGVFQRRCRRPWNSACGRSPRCPGGA